VASAPQRHERLGGVAIVLIVACCALWGLNQVIVKVTIPAVPPIMQGALRSLLAAVLVALWARSRGIALFARDGVTGPGIVAGLLFGIEFCFLYTGVQHTSASRAVLFLYLAPFVVALGMPFIASGERLRRLQSAGLLMAFAGLAVAFGDGLQAPGNAGGATWVGDALSAIAAIVWGLTTLWIRATALASAAPERTLFFQLALSAPLMAGASLIAGEPAPQLGDPLALGSLLFQSVVIAFASYLTWFWLLRHYPATRVAAFTFLTPVLGMAAGVLLLDEPMSGALLLGLAGVAVGLWLVNRR
jgi:drug/metabolite transporter (DMT)-like permease